MSSKDTTRINHQIRATDVRFINEHGEMLGVMPVREAMNHAKDAGLDLVEVSPNATPPVCKALDYGKYRYEQQKKASEAKKKQKVIQLKEVKLKPNIGEHDYQVKLKNAIKFLEDGNKVKITLRFRGREVRNSEYGMKVFNRLLEDVAEIAKPDKPPKLIGLQAQTVLSPEKAK